MTRYIGKTSRGLRRRLHHHLNYARSGEKTHRATWIRSMLKFGAEPRIDLIEMVDGDGCAEEIRWIAEMRRMGWPLTNGTDGGEGVAGTRRGVPPWNKGRKCTPEERAKISASQRGKKLSEEHKAKISAANKGRQLTEGWKISAGKKGRPNTFHKGRPLSEEHKRKLSESKRGIVKSEEHRKKIGDAFRGRPLSDEHKKKLSIANKGKVIPAEQRARMIEALRKTFRERKNEKR